jgi:hypothetical protein
MFSETRLYELGNVTDDEFNPLTITSFSAPAFVSMSGMKFLIKPNNPSSDIGMFTVQGQVSDSRLSTSFKFNIAVTNSPPVFKSQLEN